MMFVPATLALGVQIPPPVIRLVAVFAMFADRLIESGLRLFNSLLASSLSSAWEGGTAANNSSTPNSAAATAVLPNLVLFIHPSCHDL